MRKNILVVDSSLLNAKTLAMLYETFGCRVALAGDVAGAADIMSLDRFDVVVMGRGFCLDNGTRLRAVLRQIQPGLPIAAMDEHGGSPGKLLPGADFHIRPTCFFSDLCRHL